MICILLKTDTIYGVKDNKFLILIVKMNKLNNNGCNNYKIIDNNNNNNSSKHLVDKLSINMQV